MSENIRELSLDTLLLIESENRKSHLVIREVLDKYDYLDGRDKAFYKRLTEGTISYGILLDYVLNSFSKKPMEKCKPVIRAILRLSAYQVLFMEKVPDNAVCDEAVKLCRKRSFEEFTPFVNGILRNLCKNKKEALDFSGIKDECLRMSIEYSCPEWIVRMFKKEQKDVEGLLKGLLRIRPVSVRIVDTDNAEAILKEWDNSHVEYIKSEYIDNAYSVTGLEGLEELYGFIDGRVIVLDESSMMAAMATGIGEGDELTVIDACAAPGGKTSFVASKMNPKGRVLSFDVTDRKVELINDNIERLGLENVEASVKDGRVFDSSLEGIADVVIADVPCSGLGIMARKSDIKYNISNEAMMEICKLQKEIVSNVSRYVKPGGILVYSTCTIHKAENEKMVKFIESNLPFEGDSLKPFLPKLFEKERESENFIQLLPNVDGTDGFFVARFRKKAD